MTVPDDTCRLRQLAGRLDRLADGLDMARGAVLAGVFVTVMIVVLAVAVMLQPWLPRLPVGWGGHAALMIATAATWWAAHRTPAFAARLGRRLAVSRRLEAAHPELGERLSRAIGFATEKILSGEAAGQPASPSITQQLERAALHAAADALDGIDERRWLWTEPVVVTAAVVLPAAVLAAAVLAGSLASMPSWRQAVARQLGLVTAADQAERGESHGLDGEGSLPAIEPGIGELPSIEEVTLAVYREVSTLAEAWQRLAATKTDDADLVAATLQATREAARRAAWELARACHGQEPQAAAAHAMVLETLTHRLAEVADEGNTLAVDEPVRRATQAAARLASARDLARAAAGIAEAADHSERLATALADQAASTAGLRPGELPAATQTWLETVAGLATNMAIGTLSDRDTLEAVLSPLPWSQPASLADVPTADSADAIRDNRLFVASRKLLDDARQLAAAADVLGMPALDADAAWSASALARRRLPRILGAAPSADTEALDSEGAASLFAEATAAGSAAGIPTPPGDTSRDTVITDEPATAPAQPGQPAGGKNTAAAVQPGERAAASQSTTLPVWVPLAPDAAEPRQPQASPPEPPATPGYFRRLEAAVPLSRAVSRGLTTLVAHAMACWGDHGITATLLLAFAAVPSDEKVTGEATDGDEQEPTQSVSPEAPAAPRDPPDAEAASQAVERAAEWLVRVQNGDGSWGSQRFVGSVAVTAHGLLALASTGSTPAAGPHATAASRAVGFLLDHASENGLIAANEVGANGPMYGHAYAIQALAELSGESNRPEIQAVLARGCRLLEQTQNAEGGWRYQPRQGDADISVSSAVIVALEAAAAAGLDVSRETIDRGTAYLARLQNEDGGFRYQSTGGPSGSARTAAALVALSLAAPHQTQLLTAGRRWLARHPQRLDSTDGYAAYGILASSTAAWQESPSAWAGWYREIAAALLAAQRADGSWEDSSCSEYGTSAAILALTTANGLLPGLQRGQRGDRP